MFSTNCTAIFTLFATLLIFGGCAPVAPEMERPEELPTVQTTPPPAAVPDETVQENTVRTFTHDTYHFSFNYPDTWGRIDVSDVQSELHPADSQLASLVSLSVWSGPIIEHGVMLSCPDCTNGLAFPGSVCETEDVRVVQLKVRTETSCGLIDTETLKMVHPENRLISAYFTYGSLSYGFELNMQDSSTYELGEEVFDTALASFRFTE